MSNQAARTLKGNRTGTIGLVIPSIVDPFFSVFAVAAEAIGHANARRAPIDTGRGCVGVPIAEVIRKAGINEQTFYRWKSFVTVVERILTYG